MRKQSNAQQNLYQLMKILLSQQIKTPTHISHLNALGQKLIPQNINFNSPQYTDQVYRQRRLMIGEMSRDKIKEVDYTDVEHGTWRAVLQKIKFHQQRVMSEMYLKNIQQLSQTLGFYQQIPKINDLSTYLKQKTGFQIKPVAGMIDTREFLNCLAFKVFCSGQFIRHHQCLQFTAEPDLIHEFVGHVPMFADPIVAKISQKIGELSLGANDQIIEMLGFAYLCTIELGLCMQKGKRKVYGAGIAACVSDLKRFQLGDYRWKYFQPFKEFQVKAIDYQKTFQYFYLCQSFQQALDSLVKFGDHISKLK